MACRWPGKNWPGKHAMSANTSPANRRESRALIPSCLGECQLIELGGDWYTALDICAASLVGPAYLVCRVRHSTQCAHLEARTRACMSRARMRESETRGASERQHTRPSLQAAPDYRACAVTYMYCTVIHCALKRALARREVKSGCELSRLHGESTLV